MSQRGSRPLRAFPNLLTCWWAYLRITVPFVCAMTLGITFVVIAQDSQIPAGTLKTVTLRVDGTERQVITYKDTIQTLLHHQFIVLKGHDRCLPPIETTLTDGMTVTVERVTLDIVPERIPIPPPVTTRWDRRMTVTPVVIHEGRPGVAERKRFVWKKDGEISVQWVQGYRVITKPLPKIVIRGNLPSRGGIRGRKVLSMVATAYDPGPLSCGPYADGRTAIGMRATKGVIAVDPRVIPLGSRVYVEGYGLAIAGDTGGAIKGHKIDVCFDSRREALNWGRRTVKVVILE